MSLLIPLMSSSTPSSSDISSPNAAPTPPVFTTEPDNPAPAPLVPPLPGRHRSPAPQPTAPLVPIEAATRASAAEAPPWRSFNAPPSPPPPPPSPPSLLVCVSPCLNLQELSARHPAPVRQNLHALGLTATAPNDGGSGCGRTLIASRCRGRLFVGEGTRLWNMVPRGAAAAFATGVASSVVDNAGFESLFTPRSAAFVKLFDFDRVPAAFSVLFSPFPLSPFGIFVLVFFLEYDGLRGCRGLFEEGKKTSVAGIIQLMLASHARSLIAHPDRGRKCHLLLLR